MSPFHFLAYYSNKSQFFRNFMYHVPSGGLFIDLVPGTTPEILKLDKRNLLGKIAEIRLKIGTPRIALSFRGMITYATPYLEEEKNRRIGIEFFRYELGQKNYLIDIINQNLDTLGNEAFGFRKTRRFPANFRLQFQCSHQVQHKDFQTQTGQRILVVNRTHEFGRGGCSFHSTRFLKPGSPLHVRLFVKPKKEDKEMQTLDLASKVRWNDALNYNHRFMGVEFDFTDPQTAKQKASIDGLAAHIQKSLEEELFKRHLHLSR